MITNFHPRWYGPPQQIPLDPEAEEAERILARHQAEQETTRQREIEQAAKRKQEAKRQQQQHVKAYDGPFIFGYRNDAGSYYGWRDFHYEGKNMIRGIASTSTIWSDGKSLQSSGCRVKFPVPLLCAHHDLGQIGDVVFVGIEPKQVIVHGHIWDTEPAQYAWHLIQSGEMRSLSAGLITIKKTVVDSRTFIERWLMKEVSIVRKGANPDCNLEILGC